MRKVATSNDLNLLLKKKIEGIQEEMNKFTKNINEFALTCEDELGTLLTNLEKVQKNLGSLGGNDA
jgi:hypothetical protein